MSLHSPEAPSRTLTVYDMDGVLFDTENLVLEAYREAGVETYGDTPIGLSWEQWLVPLYGRERATELHQKKNVIYRQRIMRGEVEALAPFYLMKSNLHSSRVCTSASRDAADTLLGYFLGTARHKLAVRAAATPEMKIEELVSVGWMRSFEHYVYVDDRRDLGWRIVEEANRMGPATWRFVCYRGQDLETFMNEVYA